jgi:hypothetical protein
MHYDLWTTPVSSVSGNKYYIVILDDFSHYIWTFPLSLKSDAPSVFHHFHVFVQIHFGSTIGTLQCDNGKEFDNYTSPIPPLKMEKPNAPLEPSMTLLELFYFRHLCHLASDYSSTFGESFGHTPPYHDYDFVHDRAPEPFLDPCVPIPVQSPPTPETSAAAASLAALLSNLLPQQTLRPASRHRPLH